MYFFHNVYGEESDLLEDIPDGVVPVPYGWTPEAESKRVEILESLNTSVSTIPSILVYVPEHFVNVDFSNSSFNHFSIQDHRSSGWQKVPGSWVEFSIRSIEKPWTWEKVMKFIGAYHV